MGAVAHGVLGVGVHFSKADVMPMGLKHRIIAKALVSARRPDDGAIDPTLERFDMTVRPGKGEGANEMGIMAGIYWDLGEDGIPRRAV